MICFIGTLVALVSAPSNTTFEADLDFRIPKTPHTSFSADNHAVSAANHRHFFVSSQTSGLISYTPAQLNNQTFTLSRVPKNLALGTRSLTYRKDALSTDFVVTNQSRTQVFYGDISGGNPLIDLKSCTQFVEISDIHLTENAGALSYLIVADKGADAVYSFVLDPAGANLCTSMQTLSVTDPEWIQSADDNPATVYVGYRDSTGLKVRAYQANDWTTISAALSLTSSRRARFGKPLFDTTSSELLVPIQYADDDTESDYYITYDATLGASTTTTTCRGPQTIQMDYEGASRYRYIFCPANSKIEVRDILHAKQYDLPTGSGAISHLAGSDGTNRYVSILQRSANVLLHSTPVSSINHTSTTISLVGIPGSAQQFIGSGVAADTMVVSLPSENAFAVLNLSAQSLSSTLYLPRSIESLHAISSAVTYFVSPEVDTAYELSEVTSDLFSLELFSVGDYPVQIAYRTNRLYVLNRGGNSLSVINLTSRATTTLATGTRPVHFDFSTAVDRLWVANETSQNLSAFDITVGAEVALGASPIALGLSPKKVLYHASDTTLFVGSTSNVLSLNAPDFATVTTHALTTNYSDMVLTTAGVAVTSTTGNDLHLVTRLDLTTTDLDSAPKELVSNGAVAVTGLLALRTLVTSSGLEDEVPSWTHLFASPTQVVSYTRTGRILRLFPISLFAASLFPSLSLQLQEDIDRFSADTSSNLWLAHSKALRFYRVSSAYQLSVLRNRLANHPSGIAVWDAQDKIYVTLRNLDAISIVNAATGATSIFSTCQSPSNPLIDTSQTPTRLFVLCRESNTVAAVTLDGSGDFSSQSFLATGERPVAIALNPDPTNRLAIVNNVSDSVSLYNSVSLALVATTTVSEAPTDIILDSTAGTFRLGHEGAQVLTTLTSTGVATTTPIAGNGLSRLSYNSTTNRLFGISRYDRNFYMSSSPIFTFAGTSFLGSEIPESIATISAASKTYVTYPQADAIRIIDETGTITDRLVGNTPVFAQPHASTSKVFVSNFDDDSLSIINLTTNALASTVALTAGCGPTRSSTLSVGATNYIYVLCQKNDTIEIVQSTSEAVGTAISLR